MILKDIQNEVQSAQKPVPKVLQKGENFKVIAIGFKKDMILDDHKTDVPAKLVVLDGKVVYKEGDKLVMLSQYDEVPIPVDTIHSVTALSHSLCLVIKGD